MCRECFEAEDDTDCWQIVKKLVCPDMNISETQDPSAVQNYKRYLKSSLMFKDETAVLFDGDETTNCNLCLHYVLRSNDLDLVSIVHENCDSVAQIQNYRVLSNEDTSNPTREKYLSPRQILKQAPTQTWYVSDQYSNLLDYDFPPSTLNTKKPFIESIVTKRWRLLSLCPSWHVKKVTLYSDYDMERILTTQRLKVSASGCDTPQDQILSESSTGWEGVKDGNGDIWINFEDEESLLNLRSLKIEYSKKEHMEMSNFLVQTYSEEFDRWTSVYKVTNSTSTTSLTQKVSLGIGVQPFQSAEQSSGKDNVVFGELVQTKEENCPWWEGDFGEEVTIQQIDIHSFDGAILQEFILQIFDKNDIEVFSYSKESKEVQSSCIIQLPGIVGEKVIITVPGRKKILQLKKVTAYTIAEKFDEANYYKDNFEKTAKRLGATQSDLKVCEEDLERLNERVSSLLGGGDKKDAEIEKGLQEIKSLTHQINNLKKETSEEISSLKKKNDVLIGDKNTLTHKLGVEKNKLNSKTKELRDTQAELVGSKNSAKALETEKNSLEGTNKTLRNKVENLLREFTEEQINFSAASQSSTYKGLIAKHGCNGMIDPGPVESRDIFATHSITHSLSKMLLACTNQDYRPWWKGTLVSKGKISKVRIYNRISSSKESNDWIKGFTLEIYNDNTKVHTYKDNEANSKAVYDIKIPLVKGNIVRVQLPRKTNLNFREIQAFHVRDVNF